MDKTVPNLRRLLLSNDPANIQIGLQILQNSVGSLLQSQTLSFSIVPHGNHQVLYHPDFHFFVKLAVKNRGGGRRKGLSNKPRPDVSERDLVTI